jgi:hypothetical protein
MIQTRRKEYRGKLTEGLTTVLEDKVHKKVQINRITINNKYKTDILNSIYTALKTVASKAQLLYNGGMFNITKKNKKEQKRTKKNKKELIVGLLIRTEQITYSML